MKNVCLKNLDSNLKVMSTHEEKLTLELMVEILTFLDRYLTLVIVLILLKVSSASKLIDDPLSIRTGMEICFILMWTIGRDSNSEDCTLEENTT